MINDTQKTRARMRGQTGTEVVTFGCRLNAYESEVMRGLAADAALSDAVVFNTCAVTGEATRQARQAIRRKKRQRPGTRIVVTGCAAQIDPQSFADMPEVDLVLGNSEKMQAASYSFDAAGTERVRVDDIMSVTETAEHLLDGFGDRVRSFVQIQNGCDHRCTFCIIPYGRGNSRSVPAGVVVEQIRRLVDNGVPEIVLTGVDITSYGADLPGRPRLGDLIARILRLVPDLQRLRLSSLDTIEVDDALIDLIRDEPRLLPHMHLSLQSGSDMILKRMKRRHSRDDAIAFCERMRQARPDIVFGADLIAGFPTETDDMFSRTLDLVEECGLTWLHVFPFSARPGTPAARMPQIDARAIKERAYHLRALGEGRVSQHLQSHLGSRQQMLVEQPGKGRLDDYSPVSFAPRSDIPNADILPVRISGAENHTLMAELVL